MFVTENVKNDFINSKLYWFQITDFMIILMLEKKTRATYKNKVLYLDNPAGPTSCFRVPSTQR